MKPIRVLVVHRSAILRRRLTHAFGKDSTIEVAGAVLNAEIATDRVIKLRPDVVLLGLDLPGMGAVPFLESLMRKYAVPTVLLGETTDKSNRMTIKALEAGAVDFVVLPQDAPDPGVDTDLIELRTKIKIAATANLAHFKQPHAHTVQSEGLMRPKAVAASTGRIIAIGASTGGTDAIRDILVQFPPAIPGIVVVQHMPAVFTRMFAQRLNSECIIEVKEAEDGDAVLSGRALVAPGGKHMRVQRNGRGYRVEVKDGDPVCGHCPSVETLMLSVAEASGDKAIGVMLTGMGKDGAGGMKAMRIAGARTIAQDKESSVVFGMPKEAYEAGGAEALVSLSEIPATVLRLLADTGS